MLRLPTMPTTFFLIVLAVYFKTSYSSPVPLVAFHSVSGEMPYLGLELTPMPDPESIPKPSPIPMKCLTLDMRRLLVESCREKAKELKMYEHVAHCFGPALNRLAAESNIIGESSTAICISENQIIDALINCAEIVDPDDVPARDSLWDGTKLSTLKPAVRTSTITVGLTGFSFGGSVKMDVHPSKTAISSSTRDIQSAAKWNMCDRNFICCLLIHEAAGTANACLKARCIRNQGCN